MWFINSERKSPEPRHRLPTLQKLSRCLHYGSYFALCLSLQEYATIRLASNASLDEIGAVWETNAFGTLAVHQSIDLRSFS